MGGKAKRTRKAKEPRKLDPTLNSCGARVRVLLHHHEQGSCQSQRQLICPIHFIPHLPSRRAAIGGRRVPPLSWLPFRDGGVGSAVVRAAARFPPFGGGGLASTMHTRYRCHPAVLIPDRVG